MESRKLLPNDLRNAILKQKAVAFIGAGFTIPLGLPRWGALLTLLLDDCAKQFPDPDIQARLKMCQDEIAARNFTLAAWQLRRLYNKDKKTRQCYWDFFDRTFGDTAKLLGELGAKDPDAKKRMANRKANLFATRWQGIVTTNFDDFLDTCPSRRMRTCPCDSPKILKIISDEDGKPGDDSFFYIKLHSGEKKKIVFTEEDYALAYLAGSHFGNQRVPTFLHGLMQDKQLVFIGCSLEARILDVRRSLLQTMGRPPLAWALVPESEVNPIRTEMFKDLYNIKLLIYPDLEPGNPIPHHAVDQFLELTAALSPPLVRTP